MQAFLHDRRARYERLLETSTEALRAYSTRDLRTAEVVIACLDGAAREYRALGSTAGENELVALLAQFTSAREGVDPLTSKRVTVRRREMERGVALRVLLIATERLRGDHASVRTTLERTREQLAPLVVHALGRGYVTPGADGTITQTELEQMWLRLLNDEDTASAARLIALQVGASDVLLLLAELLSGLT